MREKRWDGGKAPAPASFRAFAAEIRVVPWDGAADAPKRLESSMAKARR